MWDRLQALVVEENGPTAIEYGLIAALVAVAIIAALILLGGALSNIFGYVGNTVNNASS
jgi:pilus assembly protein Flp/PilA